MQSQNDALARRMGLKGGQGRSDGATLDSGVCGLVALCCLLAAVAVAGAWYLVAQLIGG